MKEIKLTQGKVALVDDEDYERLMSMGKWQCSTGGYAVRTEYLKNESGKRIKKTIRMHRVILNAKPGEFVDHRKPGDCLNNQKSNLRICLHSDNMKNRALNANNGSGYKGVYLHRRVNRYYSQIKVDGKRIYLGIFDCPIEAARAYNAAALIHHGEFARLNEIPA